MLVSSNAIDAISSLKFSTIFEIVPARSSVNVSRSKYSNSVKEEDKYEISTARRHGMVCMDGMAKSS